MGVSTLGQRAATLRVGRVAGIALAMGALAATTAGIAATAYLMPVETGPLVAPVVVEVPAGSTAAAVGELLERQGLIRSALLFRVMARLEGLDGSLQAGYYRLRPDMRLQEVLRMMARGAVAVEQVTIPEGATIRTIAAQLQRRGLVDAERFMELASDDTWLLGEQRSIPKPPGSLEGYLFPDTYRFEVGQGEASIIQKMVARFAEKVLPVYEELGQDSGLSLHEAITLASIIEKEAMRDSERPLISSVFHNRLRLGQPLQADPTLMYVLDPAPRKLYNKHLAIDSPYNTYRYRGLPPTPIASPGLASIRAALAPADTPYLYFVARGDGTHIFSRTFQEHVRARQQVRL